jgi:MATE family multidrug resistance protein
LNKNILRLAIPSIISNISIPLLSSVDTALVGHLSEEYYLGGVAVGSMIFNTLFWAFGFLRMGTTGMTAQAYGAGDEPQAIHTLLRAIGVAWIASLLLIALQQVISNAAFFLVDSSPEVTEQAKLYFYIRIWSAPAELSLYAFMGWFLGMQNARYPMILAIVINAINIVLDVIFVNYLGMKTEGVALGSVIANYSGAILAGVLFAVSYRGYLKKAIGKRIMQIEKIKEFFSVNTDIFFRTLLLTLAYAFFTAISADHGDTILAANAILLQLLMILSYGIDGFAFAAESLVGRFFGARSPAQMKRAIKYIFAWATGIAVVVSISYLLLERQIIGVFTDQADVIAVTRGGYLWVVVAPLVNTYCFIWDGVFIGATATRAMLTSMIIATLVFYFPVYYGLEQVMGIHALWLAMTLFMATRGITLTLYAKRRVFEKAMRPLPQT